MEQHQKLTITFGQSHSSTHQIKIIALTNKIRIIEKVNAIEYQSHIILYTA